MKWSEVSAPAFVLAILKAHHCMCGHVIENADLRFDKEPSEEVGAEHFANVRSRYKMHMLSCPRGQALKVVLAACRELEGDL